LLLQQFLIGGWKEVRWAGGGGWVWVGVSGQENQLTLRGATDLQRRNKSSAS